MGNIKQHPKYPWLFITANGEVFSNAKNGSLKLLREFSGLVKIKISKGVTVNKRVSQLVWEAFNGLYDTCKLEVKTNGSSNLSSLSLATRGSAGRDTLLAQPWLRSRPNVEVVLTDRYGTVTETFESLSCFYFKKDFSKSILRKMRNMWGEDIPICEELNPLLTDIKLKQIEKPNWVGEEEYMSTWKPAQLKDLEF